VKRLAVTAVALMLSTLAAAADIAVTRDAASVIACTKLDTLHSHPPYFLPGADVRQLKKRAAELGADTILVVSRSIASEGVAYKCNLGGSSAPGIRAP
jgi:hypothetical protein